MDLSEIKVRGYYRQRTHRLRRLTSGVRIETEATGIVEGGSLSLRVVQVTRREETKIVLGVP